MSTDVAALAAMDDCGGRADYIMEYMLAGSGTDETNAAILRAMASREQSDGELVSMLDTMRRFMTPVSCDDTASVDVCGTGGDGLHTFNISTAAAFVAAAAGAVVAKHGNRSSSGNAGSAEIFERMGVDTMACPVEDMLAVCRICFMFARRYHPAARNVAAARRMLASRTVFNILGPLCNPAGVRRQLVGVSDQTLVSRVPRILAGNGAQKVVCVMSHEGADELLPVSKNTVCTYEDGRHDVRVVQPEDVGARRTGMSDMLLKGDPLEAFAGAVSGRANTGMIHAVSMNAGRRPGGCRSGRGPGGGLCRCLGGSRVGGGGAPFAKVCQTVRGSGDTGGRSVMVFEHTLLWHTLGVREAAKTCRLKIRLYMAMAGRSDVAPWMMHPAPYASCMWGDATAMQVCECSSPQSGIESSADSMCAASVYVQTPHGMTQYGNVKGGAWRLVGA